MADATAQPPKAIHLSDYQPPAFEIKTTELWFFLHEADTRVRSKLTIERNTSDERQIFGQTERHLVLNGEDMTLLSVAVNGRKITETSGYLIDDRTLTILNLELPDEQAVVEIETLIQPQENFSFEGLYRSSGKFCTQCEAEGFRKITYFLDRPDVLSVFTVHIDADREKYPVLLSNGNRIKIDKSRSDRHTASWHDPHPKPAYLFALVAGDLSCIEDRFVTMSGRKVILRIFVEEKDTDKCDHAMRSLKKAMEWDEKIYGREYDLDIFMIVAVDDFNMGAMENKGLNIFNTSCVLANSDTTTDAEFERVEAVVAHEYFHNWSGNRVTCRDWFQLSLKEGFTVFRDSEFSSDVGSRIAKRIEDATIMRTLQFAEDAGPMSHQVQPDSFIEISNFYTLTIYEKGAEIVRMIHTILGAASFRDGSDLYFDRHDGQAVTIEDFIAAMEDASGIDLSQFKRWYKQAGTPKLTVRRDYDEANQLLKLTFRQVLPGKPDALPFVIPVRFGLVNAAGSVPLAYAEEPNDSESQGEYSAESSLTNSVNVTALDNNREEALILLDQCEQTLCLRNVPPGTVPSILRGFSAPVALNANMRGDELALLTMHDTDDFNRWDASQELASREIEFIMSEYTKTPAPKVRPAFFDSLSSLIASCASVTDWFSENLPVDPDLVVAILMLPGEAILHARQKTADIDLTFRARERVRKELADQFSADWAQIYASIKEVPAQYESRNVQLRALKQICLHYLIVVNPTVFNAQNLTEKLKTAYHEASNMTEALGIVREVCWSKRKELQSLKDELLADFYQKWQSEALVVNNWFSTQASAPSIDALSNVKNLLKHPAYDKNNPNKIRSVIGAFSNRNHIGFHQASGEGYRFLAEQIRNIDQRNPQIASRLMTPFTKFARYDEKRQAKMLAAVKDLMSEANDSAISKDLYEVVSKTIAAMENRVKAQ